MRCIHPQSTRVQVEHTSTGESAWDLLSSRRYDIALVDVKLPGITGLDLSWCYESSFSEGVTVHDTIMIACTSEIDPAALYERATPVTRRQRACRPASAVACRAATRRPPASPLPRRRQRFFCALFPAPAAHSPARRHGLKDVLKKPVTMASLRHMLHKWMPRRNASSFTLQSYPTPLGRGIKSGSGIFSARILLVEDCEVCCAASAAACRCRCRCCCCCCCLPPRHLLPAACCLPSPACAYLCLLLLPAPPH